MLLRAGNRIINTDQIVEARFAERGGKNRLILYVTGHRGAENSALIGIDGDEADKLWSALCNIVEEDVGAIADQKTF
jgi:hypothetical protein